MNSYIALLIIAILAALGITQASLVEPQTLGDSGVYDIVDYQVPLDQSQFNTAIGSWLFGAENSTSSPTSTVEIWGGLTTDNATTTGTINVVGDRCFGTSCINAWSDITLTAIDAISEVPSGTINGSNTSFTLSQTPADDDSLIVSVNGQVQRNGTDLTNSGAAITFTTAPETGWTIFAHYNRESIFISAGLLNTIVTKTIDYTVLVTDGTILGDATSGDVRLTLPVASGSQGQIFVIKKIDSSVNNIILDGNGLETIDEGITATTTSQYESIHIISDGSNWLII